MNAAFCADAPPEVPDSLTPGQARAWTVEQLRRGGLALYWLPETPAGSAVADAAFLLKSQGLADIEAGGELRFTARGARELGGGHG